MSILTVADLKAHMNIVTNDDDALIASKIDAAEEWIGSFIGTPLEDLEDVPAPLCEAVRQLVAHLYENREATLVGLSMTDVSPGLYELMAPHREWVF